jgi:hypothetical protein
VGILSREDRDKAGPDLSVVIPTGLGAARNNVLVNCGDAVIAVGTCWETLSEVALALSNGRVPVIQLGGDGFAGEFQRLPPGILRAATPAEAILRTGLWPDSTPGQDAGNGQPMVTPRSAH